MRRNPDDSTAIALHHLVAGVRDGVITNDQLNALLARAEADQAPEPEMRREFNVVTVANWAGAIAVLFALGWFLMERWQQLGAGGVLAVSAAYAIAFGGVSRWLMRQGYRTAASFAATLVVATVPVITWSVLRLLGLWYESSTLYATKLTPDARASTRWIPLDVASLLAALILLRRVHFPLLIAAAAIPFWYLALHVVPLAIGAKAAIANAGWTDLVVATCLLTCGFIIHGRQARHAPEDRGEDYALWPFVIGLTAAMFATMSLWPGHRPIVPHAMLAAAVLSVVVSLRIRRREFLVAGAIGFVGYLAWLAFDVFRRTLGFPILLAGFGLAVILLAVWVQRRYPDLLARVSPSPGKSSVAAAPNS